MLQPLQAVQLIQLTQKAKQRIPVELQGPTYYSENDVWLYEQSEHPNMCEECEGYNLETFTGTELRKEFPWHEIIDINFIYPKVHPHCFCGLVRLYPVEGAEYVPDKLSTETSLKITEEETPPNKQAYMLPAKTSELSVQGINALMGMSEKDFEGAINAMLYIGYITASLARLLRDKKKQKLKLTPIEEE